MFFTLVSAAGKWATICHHLDDSIGGTLPFGARGRLTREIINQSQEPGRSALPCPACCLLPAADRRWTMATADTAADDTVRSRDRFVATNVRNRPREGQPALISTEAPIPHSRLDPGSCPSQRSPRGPLEARWEQNHIHTPHPVEPSRFPPTRFTIVNTPSGEIHRRQASPSAVERFPDTHVQKTPSSSRTARQCPNQRER